MTHLSTLIAMLLVSAAAHAQDVPAGQPVARTMRLEGRPSPPASIDQMAWLAGRWTGDGLGGVNDEVWSEARGGVMMGMFRHLKAEKPVFYEFLMLMEQQGSLVLRLKHFNPDFTGWEEKDKTVDFPLVRIEPRTAYFEGLTFSLQPDGSLRVYLALRNRQTGEVREESFHMRRVP